MGLLFTKHWKGEGLEGKGKNDMHGTWGMVDPILKQNIKGRGIGIWRGREKARKGSNERERERE
jgi:hypothetical protein